MDIFQDKKKYFEFKKFKVFFLESPVYCFVTSVSLVGGALIILRYVAQRSLLVPLTAVVAVAALVGCLAAGVLAGPLFWEVDTVNRAIRRLRRAAYFPIRTWPFIVSKWKLMTMYGGVLWLFCLAIQLLFSLLFGLGNILMFQGTLAVVFVANMIFYTIMGTVGARLGE